MNNEIIDKTNINDFKNSGKDKEGLIDLYNNNSIQKYINMDLLSTKVSLSNKVYMSKQPLINKKITQTIISIKI